MSTSQVNLSELLLKIEAELRLLELWSFESPPAYAMQSTLPFCCDTLEVEQWLQFVLIPKLNELLENRDELPASCRIAPYLEECYKCSRVHTDGLLALIREVDDILT